MRVHEVVLAGLLTALSASAAPATIDEALRATLVQMGKDDQEAIRIATANPSRELTSAESAQQNELTQRNHRLIRSIVETRGWPGRSLAGDDGAHGAWLVVQHMDDDPAFQRRCLDLMTDAFAAGEVTPHDFAYLTDRVLTAEGKPQSYGTQGSGVISPSDEARVDRNRAAIGLPPWREAVKQRQKDYEHGYGGGTTKSP